MVHFALCFTEPEGDEEDFEIWNESGDEDVMEDDCEPPEDMQMDCNQSSDQSQILATWIFNFNGCVC